MKSVKALALSTTVAVGLAGFAATDASAQSAYTVKSGDTLAKISQKFAGDNSLVNNIAAANGIANPNMIYAGSTLTIPSKGESVKAAAPAPAQQAAPQAKQAVQKKVYVAPKQQATQQKTTYKKPVTQTAQKQATNTATTSAGSNSAKEWIANKESGGSYSARSATGKYIGRYQLDRSYLNGDYSAANQERVANNYVKQRYGSWANAKAFWQKNGWY